MERLQKLLAQAGIASRRHAEEMILAGRVRVNGKVVEELGTQADPAHDTVMVDNHPVTLESKAYYILNKPRGYISDRDDTSDYKTALDLVPDGRRLFAAGRLDMMSEGMLLLTNDGELANRLTHPRYEHEKEYLVLVFGVPDDKVMERLVKGIMFDGEWMRADSAERAGKSQEFGEAGRDEAWLRIILHEGKKRQIRHMCASLGHPVKRLIRVRIGPLKLGTTKVGEWRKLSPDELALLRKTAQPRPKKQHPPQGPAREGRAALPEKGQRSAGDTRQRRDGVGPGQAQGRGEPRSRDARRPDPARTGERRPGGRPGSTSRQGSGPARSDRRKDRAPDADKRTGGQASTPGRVGGRSAQRNNRFSKPGAPPSARKSNFKKRKP